MEFKSLSLAIKHYFDLSAAETLSEYRSLELDEAGKAEWREMFAAVGITITG